MHWSQKTFHFLSVSNGPTSILSDIVITLRSHIYFIRYCNNPTGYYTKPFLWGIFEKSQIPARDVFETSQRRHRKGIFFEYRKDIFFEMFLRRLKDVTKKTSFLRCVWNVLKTSQKSHLFWDVSERSLRCLSQWRSAWDLSETSHVGWVSTFSHIEKVATF